MHVHMYVTLYVSLCQKLRSTNLHIKNNVIQNQLNNEMSKFKLVCH